MSSAKPFCTCQHPIAWFLPALFGPEDEVHFCALAEPELGGIWGPSDLEKCYSLQGKPP